MKLRRRAALLVPRLCPLYEGGPCVKCVFVDRSDLRPPLLAELGALALEERAVERMAVGRVRGLDERPAQVVGPVLAQGAAPVALAGLVDPGAEAGVADELARAREAGDVAYLGGDREGEHPADPWAAEQQRDVAVLGAELAQFTLAGTDLLVEDVNQGEARSDGRGPRLGQAEALQQHSAGGAEEVAERVGDAVLEEDRVHAVLERGAVLDEMEPEAGPLALSPDLWIGQPDLGHELEAGELGQHPGIDRVGLAGQRRDPARLGRVGDPHVPAGELEPVVDEAGAAHRLDHSDHVRIAQSLRELGQPVRVRRDGADLDTLTVTGEGLPVEALAAEVQSDVQHCRGLPSSYRGRAEFLSAGGPPSSDSVAPRLSQPGRSLRPCLGTTIAPRRRAVFRQTLLVVREEEQCAVERGDRLGLTAARLVVPL